MRRLSLIVALLAFAASARAQDPWSRADVVRESAVMAVSLADWGQTLNIEERDGCHEQNPMLGPHPSRGQVNTYFAASLLLHLGIVWALPARFRPAFQYASLGFELGIVGHNARLGLRITF